MPVFSNDATAKDLYLSALNDLLGYDKPGANPQILFQPFASLVKVSWDKQNAPDFNKYLQGQFLDMIPAWGTFAVPTSTGLYEVFGDFLQTLDNVVVATANQADNLSADDLAKVVQLQAIQKTAMGNPDSSYNLYNSQALQDWANYLVQNPDAPNSSYDKLNFLQSNSNYIIAQGFKNQADNASYQILDILSKGDPNYKLLAAAKINYDSPNNKISVPQYITDEGRIRDYISVPDQGFQQDIFKFENATLEVSCGITDQTTMSDYTETHWGGSFGVSFGFFSVGGSIHVDEINSLIHQKNISVSIKFQNEGPFIISRGGWYDQYVMDKLGLLVPEYFKETGKLSLIPQQIICARGVEIAITSDDYTASLLQTHFQSGGSFGIGPFNFGGSYDSTHIHAESTAVGQTFTVKSTEKEAYILGQLCYVPHSDIPEISALKESFLKFKADFVKQMALK